MMNKLFFVAWLALMLTGCSSSPKTKDVEKSETFRFVFLTDIHLRPEFGAIEGFQMAIDKVNALAPDFVITGGDLVWDVNGATYQRADSLYKLYNEMSEGFEMPVYNTMGNHELYGLRPIPDTGHAEYGEKMFENRIGKRFYSFDHGGWHFLILDGNEKGDDEPGSIIGKVDDTQLEWISNDLENVDPQTPIVVVIHIPLVSVYSQIRFGSLYAENQGSLVSNSGQVLALFEEMNLKLVLQGHLHIVEEINLMNRVRFINGGSVCGLWWITPENSDFQEGFVMIEASEDDFTWEYVDYGWETGMPPRDIRWPLVGSVDWELLE